MKNLVRPFSDSYADLLKTTEEALAQCINIFLMFVEYINFLVTVQDNEQEFVTRDEEPNEEISADVNEENEISEKNLEVSIENIDEDNGFIPLFDDGINEKHQKGTSSSEYSEDEELDNKTAEENKSLKDLQDKARKRIEIPIQNRSNRNNVSLLKFILLKIEYSL